MRPERDTFSPPVFGLYGLLLEVELEFGGAIDYRDRRESSGDKDDIETIEADVADGADA